MLGEKRTKVYLAGPMTGYAKFNYPAFESAASFLRYLGYKVVNPTELYRGDTSKPHHEYLRKSLKQLVKCDAISLLDGWRDSVGAKTEEHVARVLKMPRICPYTGNDISSWLDGAKR